MTTQMTAETLPLEETAPQKAASPIALAKQVALALTKWGADGRVMYRDANREWTPDIYRAYMLSTHNLKDVKFFHTLNPDQGGHHSLIEISVFADAAQPQAHKPLPHLGENALVAGEYCDYVVVARPRDANGRIIPPPAEMLFLSHHGVHDEDHDKRRILTGKPSRAVVCPSGILDPEDIARYDMPEGLPSLPDWYNSHGAVYGAARRVVLISPYVPE